MQTALSRGERITLVSVGTFVVRLRVARTGRKPCIGQEVVIVARKIPTFRAGTRLREAVGKVYHPRPQKPFRVVDPKPLKHP
jgi:nucleoid DNA-binding protein